MKLYKVSLIIISIITIQFVCYLMGCAADYREGVRLIAAGEYEQAYEILSELESWQDSEVLKEYCAVMAEYDAFNYASVFRTYNDLKGIEIDNDKLELEVACSRAEISALYIHCSGVEG